MAYVSDPKQQQQTLVMRALCFSIGSALLASGSCADPGAVEHGMEQRQTAQGTTVRESEHARAALAELRSRFAYTTERSAVDGRSPTPGGHAALGQSGVSSFEAVEGGLRPVSAPSGAQRAATRAIVTFPDMSDGPVRIEDPSTHLAVSFVMRDASRSTAETADGFVVYPHGGPAGADIVHRPDATGTEDFLAFETKPTREAVEYDISLENVGGLRLVGGALEFLDGDGAPRLRVAPPSVQDARGNVTGAVLSVDDCRVDTNASAPWGRAMTDPGASTCALTLRWTNASYPLLVDPGWSITGSMSTARTMHRSIRLANGTILVEGGRTGFNEATTIASAELYDPVSGTWAMTGPMTTTRDTHTASLLGNGQVLVAGGTNGNDLLSAELYNPASGTWSATGSMATKRFGHSASVLASGKVLIAGGANSNVIHQTGAELYDPTTGTFSVTGSLVVGRDSHLATVLASGKVLVVGGMDDNGYSKTAELYNPSTGTWAATASMATGRVYHSLSVVSGGKILIAGGINGTNMFGLSSAELYDPVAGT